MTSTRSLEVRVSEFKNDITQEIQKKDGNSDPTRCLEIIEALAREITASSAAAGDKPTEIETKTKTKLKTKKSKTKKETSKSNTKGTTPRDGKEISTTVAVVSLSPSLSSSSEEMMKKSLTASIRSFRRYKRTATTPEDTARWESAIVSAKSLCSSTVSRNEEAGVIVPEAQTLAQTEDSSTSIAQLLPKCSSSYRARLVMHKKEIYKDPPVLPPPSISVQSQICPFPTRNNTTRALTFVPGNGANNDDGSNDELKEVLKIFHPNRSPEDILRAGAFGGTYYRPITSSVTNVRYNAKQVLQDSLESEWIEGLDKSTMLTSSTYRKSINKFDVKCGGSLGMWESSGWISDVDVYGWFQWYCRFYRGRRCSDDVRQIKRWSGLAGPKGRFRSQLCNKILNAGDGGLGKVDDVKVSPVIRQTLLHWGIEITEDILVKHGKRVGRL